MDRNRVLAIAVAFTAIAAFAPILTANALEMNAVSATVKSAEQAEGKIQESEISLFLCKNTKLHMDEALDKYYENVKKEDALKMQEALKRVAIVEASEEMDMSAEPMQEATYVKPVKTYIVEKDANWFDEVQYIFEREADAVITDIETGKTFNVRRTYGTNHADIEPLTTYDADIMQEIWGSWSWDRRAVVVQVGDYIFAGSLAAMPHAGADGEPALATINGRSCDYGRGQNLDSVKENGVDGHMDLHFAGSRTHSSDRVDAKHQDMVKAAAEYIADNY